MASLSTLKKQAQSSTKWRGHSMQWVSDGARYAFGRCRRCQALASLDAKPAPNSIGISGTAVATNCK